MSDESIDLPEGWERTTLGQFVLQISYGYTASATENQTNSKFLRITDLQNHAVNWSTVPYCDCNDQDMEQEEIFKRMNSLLKSIDRIQQQYEAAKARLEKLDRAILTKAFRGELVPQDPNDEPASVLLDRIREERAKKSDSFAARGRVRSSTKRKRT